MALTVKRPEQVVSLCLDGGLVAEHDRLQVEIEEAGKKYTADRRLTSVNPVVELNRKLADLYERQKAETVHFTLRGLRRDVWDGLKTANPARKDNVLDERYGYDVDAIVDAAMSTEGTIAGVVDADGEPVEFTHEEWAGLSADFTRGQWASFQVPVLELNGSVPSIPFSHAAYKTTQGSGEK
ncbi:hypothetical protein ACT3R5_15970 [Glutamicibacter sp. AOP5-A2-7]